MTRVVGVFDIFLLKEKKHLKCGNTYDAFNKILVRLLFNKGKYVKHYKED